MYMERGLHAGCSPGWGREIREMGKQLQIFVGEVQQWVGKQCGLQQSGREVPVEMILLCE